MHCPQSDLPLLHAADVCGALAVGHPFNLLLGVPIYIFGTALRIGPEERLLRERYGAQYDTYAARVKRLIPFVW